MGGRRSGAKTSSVFRTRITKSLQTSTILTVADNSGAKLAKIIAVKGYHGRLNRYPKACVGDLVIVSIKKGNPDLRKKILKAVIVRQKKEIRRLDGSRISFEDNACCIVADDGDPKGSRVSGPIAREAADLWPRLSNIASLII
ncbi:50S ribosomal protein L14 [Candidatus Lokiarchaeum ossiferum]|uniref:Large ribosomal subunit protein uL14 n=1 Tax=Candidatus Lokiarchaeum ossiferum TaxID=2951803 RepID=A0ABY6HUT2_9ARCH|nr:50S ribosomal protein L14 [Candidatus Lokiarchaeum sp. B-35]